MKKKHLTTFEDHLDRQYGKRGSKKREEYERGFESFKLGVMIRQAREELNLTQSALAKKAHTNKSYISRIENDASDIRLSTLRNIIEQGLGGKLKISVEM
jgi:HTH-type transcriptional regulator/antitoxin HipB